MKPQNLLLRCMAQKDGGVWVASCVDLCLASQGDTFVEAKEKLEHMIFDYAQEAVSVDREHAKALLTRKAPLAEMAKYYYYSMLLKVGAAKNGFHKLFVEPLPLTPCK